MSFNSFRHEEKERERKGQHNGNRTDSNRLSSVVSQRSISSSLSIRRSRPIFKFLSKLQYGTIEFSSDGAATTVQHHQQQLTQEQLFVYVPEGYTTQHEQSLWRILHAIQLMKLPNLILSVASSVPSSSSSTIRSNNKKNTNDHNVRDLDLYLEATINFCSSVGGWIIPDRVWNSNNRNSSSQLIGYTIERITSNNHHQQQQQQQVDCQTTDGNSIHNNVISLALLATDEPFHIIELDDKTSSSDNNRGGSREYLAAKSASEYLTRLVTEQILLGRSGSSPTKHQQKLLRVKIPVSTSTLPPFDTNFSHYIIFQSYQDKIAFYNYLMELVPDLLLVLPTSDPTTACRLPIRSKQQIIRSAYLGTPICLLYNSYTPQSDTTKFAKMFHHANDELINIGNNSNDQENQISTETDAASTDTDQLQTTISIRSIKETTAVDNVCDQIIDKFLKNWPSGYQKDSIVLIDFDDNNGIKLQEYRKKLLKAIQFAFDTTTRRQFESSSSSSQQCIPDEPLDATTIPKKIIDPITSAIVKVELAYTLACIDILQRTRSRYKRQVYIIELLYITSTLLAIVAAVLYARIYGSSSTNDANDSIIDNSGSSVPPLDDAPLTDLIHYRINVFVAQAKESIREINIVQLLLFSSTIIIPFVVSYLQKQHNSNDRWKAWSTIELAIQQLESEVIQFRMQSNHYLDLNYNNNNNATNDQTAVEGNLLSACQSQWNKIYHYVSQTDRNRLNQTISKIATQPSPSEPEDAKNSNSTRSKSTRQIQIDIGRISNEIDETTPLFPSLSVSVDEEDDDVENPQQTPTEKVETHDPTKWTKQSSSRFYYDDYPNYDSFSQEPVEAFHQNSAKDIDIEPIVYTPNNEGDNTDSSNCFCLMTPEEYLAVRLDHQLDEKKRLLQADSHRKQLIDVLIKYLTLSTSIMALLSYQWAIPIALGLASSFGMSRDHQRHDQDNNALRSLVSELEDVKGWWLELQTSDQQIPENTDKLVSETEKSVARYYNSIFGTV